MSEYEFTLRFCLPEGNADPAQFVTALADAGCDDATIGIGRRGRIALAFAREADSASEAIASAEQAVRQAIPGAALISLEGDAVAKVAHGSPPFAGMTAFAG